MSETKLIDLFLGVEHEADDIGLAGAQADAGAVRPIADLLGDKLDAPPGLGADLGRVLQCARYGGDAQPGHEGERLQRRPVVRRRFVVLACLTLCPFVPPVRRIAAAGPAHNRFTDDVMRLFAGWIS